MNNKGAKGEDIAAAYLESKGWIIIFRNYISRYGEIDIIARQDELLIFAEVKARSGRAVSRPCEAVDIRKQRKIIKTALCFLGESSLELQPRFDVIEIYNYNTENRINHIENAFTAEVYNEGY